MRALLNSLCNIVLMFYIIFDISLENREYCFYIMFYISLENRWYQGCYGGMKIMCFYFLIIGLKMSLNQKIFFFLNMRALLNIVCNIILNVLHFMTI